MISCGRFTQDFPYLHRGPFCSTDTTNEPVPGGHPDIKRGDLAAPKEGVRKLLFRFVGKFGILEN
jgi:hypothetical protein